MLALFQSDAFWLKYWETGPQPPTGGDIVVAGGEAICVELGDGTGPDTKNCKGGVIMEKLVRDMLMINLAAGEACEGDDGSKMDRGVDEGDEGDEIDEVDALGVGIGVLNSGKAVTVIGGAPAGWIKLAPSSWAAGTAGIAWASAKNVAIANFWLPRRILAGIDMLYLGVTRGHSVNHTSGHQSEKLRGSLYTGREAEVIASRRR